MLVLPTPRVSRQAIRSLGIAALALTGLSCQDKGLTGPGLPQRARLSVAPSFNVASDMPTIRLSKVKAEVFRIPSGEFVLQDSAFFSAADSTVSLAMTVTLREQDEVFRVRLSAWDDSIPPKLVYVGERNVQATMGAIPGGAAEIALRYVGPDTLVRQVKLAPWPDTVMTLGDQFTFRSRTFRADSTLVAAHVGWVSRDTNVVTIDRNTGIARAKAEGGVWIVGTTFSGRRDSVRVSVTQAVATVTVAPAPADIIKGRSLQLVATVKDAGGRDMPTRPITWRSADTTIARVSSTGMVLGVALGSTTISATSGSVTAVVAVNVIQVPVFRVVVAPVDTTIYIGESGTLRGRAEDELGNLLSGRPLAWTSLNPAVATVDIETGRVTGVAAGTVTITATSETKSATAIVRVIAIGSVVLTPQSDTVAVGDSIRYTAVARDSTGTVMLNRRFAWSTVNPAIATVDSTGTVKGVANGVTQVIASVGGRADTSDVRVQPLLDRVVITPSSRVFTSLNDSAQFTAAAYVGQSVVPGSFTFVSRNDAVATVSASGLVIARGNGVVYIVAIEAGGASDSSRVTVQQQVSSVTITPATRTLFIGTNFQLSATAVDGRGNPMPAATTFAWSSSASAVVSTDSAGRLTALTSGTATISATAGGVTGTSVITVLSPITRIVVTPATATLASLGNTASFTATAYDTLDAVMTGVSFTWSSSNPSVAPLDSTTTATSARAVSVTNGFTSIRATAQGVTGAASLTVQQVLAALEVTPPSVSVAPNGTVSLLARGKDANNRYMTAGAVTWSSDNTAIASVSSAGVVTGVAVGTAKITATSGTIVSNQAVITVSNTVPPVISFGRDTIPVGRGSSTSIPLFLSMPSQTPVTVNLATADTVAFFSTATATFPANTTSINVTLNGRNAGTTRLFATDAGGVYAGDTSVVTVQASVRISGGSVYINANDQVSRQVLLSDPSPAGGTYVTFAYSTAGVASVSPDPAFIPAGQLAADIIIRAVAAGNTNITPIASGVNGTATYFDAAVPKLTLSYQTQYLGAGQYQPNHYVYTPRNVTLPLTVALTSNDTTVMRTESSVTIPSNTNYAYFNTRGLKPGTARTLASAAGWQPDTGFVTVTTPRIGVCCGTTLNTTSPTRNITVYSEDSLGTAHYRINSLVVSLRSTDTSVIRLLDSTVTIQAAQYFNSSGRVAPVGGGSAWVIASAGGHFTDSTRYTVIGPKLRLSFYSFMLGVGQSTGVNGVYVYTPDNVTSPLAVSITSADTNRLATTQTVTIPAGTNYAYFEMRGKAPTTGSLTVISSAPGYTADTGFVTVTSPRVTSCCSATLNNFGSGRSFTVYTTDSLGSGHITIAPVRFTLVSSDTNVIRIDSAAVTVAAGQSSNSSARIRPVGVGTAKVYVTGPTGYINDSSVVYTVVTPKLYLSWFSNFIGLRQTTGATGVYVSIPDNRTDTLRISIVQKHRERVQLIGADTSIKIPPGRNYEYFGYNGIGLGGDTIIVSAVGYLPDTAFVTVTTPQLKTGGLPGTATTTSPAYSVYVQTSDSVGNVHASTDTVTVRVVSSDSNVVRPESAYVHIVKGQSFRYTTVRFVGPGSATITFSDSAGLYRPVTTNSVTVTGPSLRLSTTSYRLGMRQYDPNQYVATSNPVTGSPLVVRLRSTDTRVATVPDSVIIPVGSNFAYFRTTAQDTVGTIQIQATATGYSPVNAQLQVTQPRFLVYTPGSANTTSPPQYLHVYAADAFNTSHPVNEDVVVTLSSSAPNVATTDSATVTIVKDAQSSTVPKVRYGVAGTARITASDSRAAIYRYDPGFADVTVNTPSVSFSFITENVAVGQYLEPYVSVPNNATDTVTVTLTHVGNAETSTPATVKILPGRNLEYFRITGNSTGTDTLRASAPGHNSDSSYVKVGTGRVDPIGGWPSSLAVGKVATLTLYTRDQNGQPRAVSNATTFALSSNANIAFYATATGTTPLTDVTVAAQASSVTFYMKALSAGNGSGTITSAGYATYTNSVTVTP